MRYTFNNNFGCHRIIIICDCFLRIVIKTLHERFSIVMHGGVTILMIGTILRLQM